MLWFQIPPATLVMGSNPTSCNQFAGLFCYFLGTFGCDTGMKLPDHIKPMTGFQIGNSVLLPEGPAGLGPAQKMRKTRPWLLSDVNTVFFFGLARSSPNKASYWLYRCMKSFSNDSESTLPQSQQNLRMLGRQRNPRREDLKLAH